MEPYEASLAEAAASIAAGELSPRELTESVLKRIHEVDPRICAYVRVTEETARLAAAQAEQEIGSGTYRGPLHGIPMALKDVIDTKGVPTESGSQVRAGRVPTEDSAVAARLRAAGAVLLGKTHTYEFAYGLDTPQTRNPWAPDRIVGGSSGGSAAAVAVGAATFALGTDTGGSIRVPSALTGVVGMKPTYGLISRCGTTPLSWSLDHLGPVTRTVEDAGLVIRALAGHDPRDTASVRQLPRDWPGRPAGGLGEIRLGVPENYYFRRVRPEVESAVRAAVQTLADLGVRLVDVHIPMTEYVQAVQWAIMMPEASCYHRPDLQSRAHLYGADVRLLLEAGELVPATDYVRAQRARTLMREAWARLFRRVDVIAAPSLPLAAVPVGCQEVNWADGTSESVTDALLRFSAPANITGVPSISLPVGSDHDGLPIGMQLMGRPLSEGTLLQVAEAYEAARGPFGTPSLVS
ncbi:amidase [Streptomyces sp. NPDC057271]|uniref:amidase n=1 Tax=unclassified Streptomyces TaxID=2593676 RepID=UPI003633B7F1